MAKTWFPHEDNLKDGEESQPLYGRRFSAFWWFAMIFTYVGGLALLWMSIKFVFSHSSQ